MRRISCKPAAVKKENKKPIVQKLLEKSEMSRQWGPDQVDVFYLADAFPSQTARDRSSSSTRVKIASGSCLLPTRRLRRNKRASLSPNFGRLAIAFFFLGSCWISFRGIRLCSQVPSIHAATESCPLLTKRRCSVVHLGSGAQQKF